MCCNCVQENSLEKLRIIIIIENEAPNIWEHLFWLENFSASRVFIIGIRFFWANFESMILRTHKSVCRIFISLSTLFYVGRVFGNGNGENE